MAWAPYSYRRETSTPKNLRNHVSTPFVTILDLPPLFPSTSRTSTGPEPSPSPPRDPSSSHVPLGSHVIHPRVPTRQMPRPATTSRPRWLRPFDSPPVPPSPPKPEQDPDDPRIDAATLDEEPTLLRRMIARLPRRWAPNPMDID